MTPIGGMDASTPIPLPYAIAAAQQNPQLAAAAPADEGPSQLPSKQLMDNVYDGFQSYAGGSDSTSGSGNASGGILDATGDKVSDAQLGRIFGSDAQTVHEMLNNRSDLTVRDLLPLAGNQDGIDTASKLLSDRPDLQIGDVLSKDADGSVGLNPILKDSGSLDMLNQRQDIKPGDLLGMRSTMARNFDNPAEAQEAYGKGLELLKNRSDLMPNDVGSMLSTMGGVVKDSSKGGSGAGSTLLDMFGKATQTLAKRTDLGTGDMSHLATQAGQTFGGKEPNGLSNLADGFATATDMLNSRDSMSASQVGNVMSTINNRFGGQGQGDNKTLAFSKAANLMNKMPTVNADGIEHMFKKAAEGPPAKSGDKLVEAFGEAAGDVLGGKTTVDSATRLKGQQTDRQVDQEKQRNDEHRVMEGRLKPPPEKDPNATKKEKDDAANKEKGQKEPGTPQGGADKKPAATEATPASTATTGTAAATTGAATATTGATTGGGSPAATAR